MEKAITDLFDGSPEVTVDLTSVDYATVVAAAESHGYRLVHPAENQHGPFTLLFEKN